jgi:hypothetical protein
VWWRKVSWEAGCSVGYWLTWGLQLASCGLYILYQIAQRYFIQVLRLRDCDLQPYKVDSVLMDGSKE